MGSRILYISIAYYMQKGGGWVQIACTIAYVLNRRPHIDVAYIVIDVHLGNKETDALRKCPL